MLQIKNVPRPSFGGVARNPLLSLGRLHKAYFIVVEVLLVVNYFEIMPEVLGFAWIHLLSMHLLPSGEC